MLKVKKPLTNSAECKKLQNMYNRVPFLKLRKAKYTAWEYKHQLLTYKCSRSLILCVEQGVSAGGGGGQTLEAQRKGTQGSVNCLGIVPVFTLPIIIMQFLHQTFTNTTKGCYYFKVQTVIQITCNESNLSPISVSHTLF